MKNILLLIHEDPGEEARFQAALDLTRCLSGHLTCIDIVELPVLMGTDYMMADAELAWVTAARAREAVNRQRTEARMTAEAVSWDWVDATGDIAPLVEAHARLADIIVLNTAFADPQLPDMRAIVSSVVMRARKPVLAVPQEVRGLNICGHALIGWNGSPPVTETLRALIPLLALAESVTIVEIGKIAGPPAEEAATYLSRHGIHADIDRHLPVEWTVSDTLLAACRERKPAYCVLGAYGHSRLREWLIGGVTRRMLADSPVPLILGH